MSKRITKSFATNKTTSEDVKKWISEQFNFNDSVIYLIEKEIYQNGIRDLSSLIPRQRTNDYFNNLFEKEEPYVQQSIEDKNIKLKESSTAEIKSKEIDYQENNKRVNNVNKNDKDDTILFDEYAD
jgi:hypothetical protein